MALDLRFRAQIGALGVPQVAAGSRLRPRLPSLSPDPPLIFVWWVKIRILVCGGVCWDVGMREPPVLRLLRGPGRWVGGVMWSAAQGDGGDAVQCGGDRLRPGPGGR